MLTSSFVEASLLKLVADLVILALISRHVEENTDYLRLALYIAVVAVGSALCTGTAVFVGFVITRMEGLLFSVCRTTTTTTTPQVIIHALFTPENMCCLSAARRAMGPTVSSWRISCS